MQKQLCLIFFALFCVSAQAQIGEVTIAATSPGHVAVGEGTRIGKALLPVCRPQAAVCGVTTYIFTGNGNWSVAANWLGEAVPPLLLPAGQMVLIQHLEGGECILNVPQIISDGAMLDLPSGKRLRVASHLTYLK